MRSGPLPRLLARGGSVLCPAGAAGRSAVLRAGTQPTRPQIFWGSGYMGQLPPEHPQRDVRSSETPPAAAEAAAPCGSLAHAAAAHTVHAAFCAGQRRPRAISLGQQPSGGQPAWRSSMLLRPRASSSAIPALASILPKAGSVQTAARRSRSSCAERPGTVQSPGRAAGRARSRPAPGIWRCSRPAPVLGEAEPAVHAAAVCSASRARMDTMLLSALFLEDGVEMGPSLRGKAWPRGMVGHQTSPGFTHGVPFPEPYMHQARSRAVTTHPVTHAHGAPLSCSEFMGAQRSDCPAPAFPSLGFPVAEPRCCLSKSSLARLPCQ